VEGLFLAKIRHEKTPLGGVDLLIFDYVIINQ
jgi:hypothetical protein